MTASRATGRHTADGPDLAGRRLVHIALAADWAAAQHAGEYRVSTLGRTYAEVGYIHASFAEQVAGTVARFYADVTSPLVLLTIDPGRLGCDVVVEPPAPGIEELYPHIYGPIPIGAVTAVEPFER